MQKNYLARDCVYHTARLKNQFLELLIINAYNFSESDPVFLVLIRPKFCAGIKLRKQEKEKSR